MKKQFQVSKMMFVAAGLLWILEAIGEIFGGYVSDFNKPIDYLSEITFGFSYLALFLATLNLIKGHLAKSEIKLSLLGKISMGFLTIAGVLMPIKSMATAAAGIIGGYTLVSTAEAAFIGPIFLAGVFSSLVGTILFGIACWKLKSLSKLTSILMLISMLLVFVPVIGKYLTAAIYFIIALEVSRKQEKIDLNQNMKLTTTN